MYSHDTMGLGHIRRNLLIAQALAKGPINAEVLLISGIRQAGSLLLPPGVDLVTLPAYRKDPDGSYRPDALGDDVHQLTRLRAEVIRATLRRYPCDLLVVDNVPRGALGELSEALAELRSRRATRCVLGLRDVLDDPAAVRRQWTRQRNEEAIRDCFDHVWVYGDARVCDAAAEYDLDARTRSRLEQIGYLDPAEHYGAGLAPLPGEITGPYSLCVLGGGQDGWELARAFARARLPDGEQGVIVCGMRMPEQQRRALHQIAANRARLCILDAVRDPIRLMREARRVVAMGGYNTVTEILSLGCRALVVPRVTPRQEQWIRARRLSAMGLIDVMHPDRLSVQALGDWLVSDPRPIPDVRERLAFDGLARLRQRVQQWFATDPRIAGQRTTSALC
ncbi:MAG: glycosyl transferase family 28 [Burkholderiaceae bacterium]